MPLTVHTLQGQGQGTNGFHTHFPIPGPGPRPGPCPGPVAVPVQCAWAIRILRHLHSWRLMLYSQENIVRNHRFEKDGEIRFIQGFVSVHAVDYFPEQVASLRREISISSKLYEVFWISQGGANPKGEGPTYYLAKICQKCMEMKKIGPSGGNSSKILLCRFSTQKVGRPTHSSHIKYPIPSWQLRNQYFSFHSPSLNLTDYGLSCVKNKLIAWRTDKHKYPS